jgi:hypothetical protein
MNAIKMHLPSQGRIAGSSTTSQQGQAVTNRTRSYPQLLFVEPEGCGAVSRRASKVTTSGICFK